RREAVGADSVLLAEPLIGTEEEKLVFLDRAANRAAEQVLVQNLGLVLLVETQFGVLVKEIVAIECAVAEELPGGAVKIVRAAPGHHVDACARVTAILGIVLGRLNFE